MPQYYTKTKKKQLLADVTHSPTNTLQKTNVHMCVCMYMCACFDRWLNCTLIHALELSQYDKMLAQLIDTEYSGDPIC